MTSDGAGDAGRFRALYQAHWADVERYAVRRCETDMAADVAAEVFVIAWRRFNDVPTEPLPWLYGVARRVLANQRRGAQRSVRLVERIASAHVDPLSSNVLTADLAESVTSAIAVARAFNRLPDLDREVLALKAWEGLAAREAAVVLGCGVGAVTMRVSRARRRLRRLLVEEGSVL